jgi:hypothetical protein
MRNNFFIQENIHYIWERGVEFPRLKGKYNVMCMDGIAYAKRIRGSEIYEIIYPKMEEIDYDQQMRIQGHRGLDKGSKIGYNDVMVILGRIKQTIIK